MHSVEATITTTNDEENARYALFCVCVCLCMFIYMVCNIHGKLYENKKQQ